jgi:low affinity Fe/Cu permease
MDKEIQKYRMICTLTFGDIYGQIIVWLGVIFITLATTLALWSSTRQIYALATVGIVLVLSLPFLLFTFVTTLLNHIEFQPIQEEVKSRKVEPAKRQSNSTAPVAS